MRHGIAALLSGLVVASASVHAAKAPPSPLIGRWTLDTSRMTQPPEARPKRVTIAFALPEVGRLGMAVDIVDAAGATTHFESTSPLDATPIRFERNVEADASAMTMPAPNVLVLGLGRQGMPASTRVYTVAADGHLMTEIASYVGADGLPLLRTNHFTREH